MATLKGLFKSRIWANMPPRDARPSAPQRTSFHHIHAKSIKRNKYSSFVLKLYGFTFTYAKILHESQDVRRHTLRHICHISAAHRER